MGSAEVHNTHTHWRVLLWHSRKAIITGKKNQSADMTKRGLFKRTCVCVCVFALSCCRLVTLFPIWGSNTMKSSCFSICKFFNMVCNLFYLPLNHRTREYKLLLHSFFCTCLFLFRLKHAPQWFGLVKNGQIGKRWYKEHINKCKSWTKKLSHACSNLWEQEVQKSIIPQRTTWRLSIPNFFSSHDHEVNKGTATFIDTRSFS